MIPFGSWIAFFGIFRRLGGWLSRRRRKAFDAFMEKALHGKNLKDQ